MLAGRALIPLLRLRHNVVALKALLAVARREAGKTTATVFERCHLPPTVGPRPIHQTPLGLRPHHQRSPPSLGLRPILSRREKQTCSLPSPTRSQQVLFRLKTRTCKNELVPNSSRLFFAVRSCILGVSECHNLASIYIHEEFVVCGRRHSQHLHVKSLFTGILTTCVTVTLCHS